MVYRIGYFFIAMYFIFATGKSIYNGNCYGNSWNDMLGKPLNEKHLTMKETSKEWKKMYKKLYGNEIKEKNYIK